VCIELWGASVCDMTDSTTVIAMLLVELVAGPLSPSVLDTTSYNIGSFQDLGGWT
jgi:hypothetical protein